LPSHILRAGGFDDPFANRDDQASLLGKRNETAGRQQAEIGMSPTQQCLDAHDTAVAEVLLWLVVQQQLVAFERIPQTGLKRQPFNRLACDILDVEAEAIAA